MNDQMIEELSIAGVDIESAKERFMGNLSLLERFLKKFPEDKNYNLLIKAMEEENVEDAFVAAHTLKGTCGNLSFTHLFQAASDITEALRAGDLERAKELLPRVTTEYQKMIATIDKL